MDSGAVAAWPLPNCPCKTVQNCGHSPVYVVLIAVENGES